MRLKAFLHNLLFMYLKWLLRSVQVNSTRHVNYREVSFCKAGLWSQEFSTERIWLVSLHKGDYLMLNTD